MQGMERGQSLAHAVAMDAHYSGLTQNQSSSSLSMQVAGDGYLLRYLTGKKKTYFHTKLKRVLSAYNQQMKCLSVR